MAVLQTGGPQPLGMRGESSPDRGDDAVSLRQGIFQRLDGRVGILGGAILRHAGRREERLTVLAGGLLLLEQLVDVPVEPGALKLGRRHEPCAADTTAAGRGSAEAVEWLGHVPLG